MAINSKSAYDTEMRRNVALCWGITVRLGVAGYEVQHLLLPNRKIYHRTLLAIVFIWTLYTLDRIYLSSRRHLPPLTDILIRGINAYSENPDCSFNPDCYAIKRSLLLL